LVENGIPPSPFIRQLLKRAPIEGDVRRESGDREEEIVGKRREVVASLGINWLNATSGEKLLVGCATRAADRKKGREVIR
jgi:hypothetical protein